MLKPLNAELNPIRHLLALAGARHFVHVSRVGVNTCEFFFSNTVLCKRIQRYLNKFNQNFFTTKKTSSILQSLFSKFDSESKKYNFIKKRYISEFFILNISTNCIVAELSKYV